MLITILDWAFGAVVVVILFSFGVVLGVIPEPYQDQAPAVPAVVLRSVVPTAEGGLKPSTMYPERYKEFEEGFIPEFKESFRISCGKDASSAMAEEACRVSFDVMVNRHFGGFSKQKLSEIMADDTHEEWVGFTIMTPALKRELESALMPIVIRRMTNRTLYE